MEVKIDSVETIPIGGETTPLGEGEGIMTYQMFLQYMTAMAIMGNTLYDHERRLRALEKECKIPVLPEGMVDVITELQDHVHTNKQGRDNQSGSGEV